MKNGLILQAIRIRRRKKKTKKQTDQKKKQRKIILNKNSWNGALGLFNSDPKWIEFHLRICFEN